MGERTPLSRRSFLAALGAGVGVAASGLSSRAGATLDAAVNASPSLPAGGASLGDIEHIVILMQENRSFDHYFGTLSGVTGFSDRHVVNQQMNGRTYPIWDQFGYQPGVGAEWEGYLQPFHLLSNPPTEDGQTTNDISHDWPTQHLAWNDGAMNQFVLSHLASDGDQNGPLTMGYFTRQDLAFYYALADAFTICDNYFCSVLGPTDPNRLMSLSASIDPAGTGGGPVLVTFTDRPAEYGKLDWATMPEALLSAGVSWKVYNDPSGLALLNPLPYFKAYNDQSNTQLISQALAPVYPTDFETDVLTGNLPAVSWIHGPVAQCEHPASPPEYGENLVQQILNILVSNPDVWARTLFILTYDENGGFFDHVPPPVPPAGTAGEYLTANPLPSAAGGIAGPIGLGFRVPCLLVSPFTRGGYLSSAVYDHTSILRLIETRFGVPVPNLTAWRRQAVGDLTAGLDLRQPPNNSVPPLPPTSLGDTTVAEQAVINAFLGTFDQGQTYPLPTSNSMPSQETSPSRPPVPAAGPHR